MTASAFHTIRASRLKVGSRLKFPIHDERDVLLLAAGQVATKAFIKLLRQRGVLTIRVHSSELARLFAGEPQGTATTVLPCREGVVCPLHNAGTDQLDALIRHGHLDVLPRERPLASQLRAHGAAPYDEGLKDEFVERQAQGVGRVREVFASLAEGSGLDLDALGSVTEDALTDLVHDADLFTCVGINPFSDDYPARHSLHVCMLALSVGARLNLGRQGLRELAAGCLIHDAGMLRIEKSEYGTHKVLGPVAFLEITKHPIHIFDMIQNARSVSCRSAMVAYQMHERCNGSGYPRRREAAQLHTLSKIAAVADAYVGLVSARPHRPALLPYCAMEQMLQGAAAGLFDRAAVRALLEVLSLFPLGSYVQLSDGRAGRVIRSNREAYTTPILEVWGDEDRQEAPEVLNLLEARERIVRVLPGLESAA